MYHQSHIVALYRVYDSVNQTATPAPPPDDGDRDLQRVCVSFN